MAWDVTVVAKMVMSHMETTSIDPGFAVAEGEKRAKYGKIGTQYIFAPLGSETLCSRGPESIA